MVSLLNTTDIFSNEVPSTGEDDLENFICTKFLKKHSILDSSCPNSDDSSNLADLALSSLYECLNLLVKYDVYRVRVFVYRCV